MSKVRETYATVDVFTPARPASLSFVPRIAIDSQVKRVLRTPGKQIVVFGHSGSGKTTLIINELRSAALSSITTRCTKESTFESIVLSAFDKLNPFFSSESQAKESSSAKSNIEGTYKLIKASLEHTFTSEQTEKSIRLLPPQLTAERLAEFCGAAKCCWVVEDFHKVATPEKVKLAQSMKVFMDTAVDYPHVKVIAIGAVDTAREVVQYDPEMSARVAEIAVPLLSQEELTEILTKGEQLLNVRFGNLKEQIAAYASGLGAVCHQLGLNICLAANINETAEQEFWFTAEHLKTALQSYMVDTSDSLKAAFDMALKRKRRRKFDNTNLILKAITLAGEKGASYPEILDAIRLETPDYPQGNLMFYLKELESPERGEILRHDPITGRFYYNEPLYLAYAQCLFVPPKDPKRVEMNLLGIKFTVDLHEFARLRRQVEDQLVRVEAEAEITPDPPTS